MIQLRHTPPASFFEPEVRLGNVEVTARTKQLWAVQIDMMQELVDVCNRLGIRIYADGGTMLGAVRHQGFIPWDDDIDMTLLRADYDRLMKEGPALLGEEYFLQDISSDPYYRNRHARLRNSRTACWPIKQRKHRERCNRGIFIDIFPADSMPNNPREFQKFFTELRRRKAAYCHARSIGSRLPRSWYVYLREHVPFLSDKHQFQRYEQLLRSVDAQSSALTCEVCFRHYAPFFPTVLFGEPQIVPFEYTQIPIMQGAHEALRLQYGDDYMTPRKLPSFHSDFDFDVDHGFLEVLGE
ncbi:MAG: LicD family protein [Bacteroidales bacterium]|nr:LicD family protein [Candidatus Liminaster caballi]